MAERILFKATISYIESFFRDYFIPLHIRVKTQMNYVQSNGGMVVIYSEIIQVVNEIDKKNIKEFGIIFNKAFSLFKMGGVDTYNNKDITAIIKDIYSSLKSAIDSYNKIAVTNIVLVDDNKNIKNYEKMLVAAKNFCLIISCIFNPITRSNALRTISDSAILDTSELEKLAISTGFYHKD